MMPNLFHIESIDLANGQYVARCIGGRWRFYYRYGFRGLRLIPLGLQWRKSVVRLFWPIMVAIAAGGAA